MARSRGRYLLLLNEDSELTAGAANALRAQALGRAAARASPGARIVDAGGRAAALGLAVPRRARARWPARCSCTTA